MHLVIKQKLDFLFEKIMWEIQNFHSRELIFHKNFKKSPKISLENLIEDNYNSVFMFAAYLIYSHPHLSLSLSFKTITLGAGDINIVSILFFARFSFSSYFSLKESPPYHKDILRLRKGYFFFIPFLFPS